MRIIKVSIWLIAVGVFLICAGTAFASDDDCRGGHSQCGHDDGGDPIDIDIDAGGGEGGDADADANADAAAESSATANGEQNVTFEGSRSPGRGYVGGGSSSADHQKVRAISGGWLTGMAAIRWDATDKELRALHRADNLRARGLIEAADQLECSTKVIYKAVGGSRAECVVLLTQERELISQASTRDAEQDALIESLQLQIASIYETEIPQAQDTHSEILMEVARVQQVHEQAPAPAGPSEEFQAFQREYNRDAESRKMSAQQTLDTLYDYSQQAEEEQ